MKYVLIAAVVLWQISDIHGTTGPDVMVDFSKPPVAELKRFWDSTGLCPLGNSTDLVDYILSESEFFNLGFIGSLPGKGITSVRIHWLLYLITESSEDESGYNFMSLDRLLDWLQTFGLYTGFELMGNPSEKFNDFGNKTQVDEWRRLVQQTASRYIERYGLETVERWKFETWNEPDYQDYNLLNLTLENYLRYFTASVQGLEDAGQGRLSIGGPAGLFEDRDNHPRCWGLLEYCANMTTCPLDFISFHRKGGGQGAAILEQDVSLTHNLSAMFPTLAEIPFANDESDPLVTWSLNLTWRGDVRYAAIVASVIAAHQKVMVREHGIPATLLSNDNAFLNYDPFYFNQRTLLARFQMNETDPPHVQFIRKPVYTTMALLSFLGNQELDVAVTNSDNRLYVLAAEDRTQDEWSSAVLLVFSNDTEEDLSERLSVSLHILNVSHLASRYVLYLLDNEVTNPQEVWWQANSSVFPNLMQRAEMRSAEGPHRMRGPAEVPSSGDLRLELPMSLPSIALLHICAKGEPPGEVSRLFACNVTYNEVMLFWSDNSVLTRCIKTYEVEFSPGDTDEFKRVNVEDTIFLSYQYVVDSHTENVQGKYRVRAVDYWDRPGPYSSPIRYPGDFPCFNATL